ncbi:MAG: sulfur carrier protein ThiS [Candidatus Latescibacteria bacterium]|nr:sulfur carrier protein ThiS [Candidatus Latescibacterota bacterium]
MKGGIRVNGDRRPLEDADLGALMSRLGYGSDKKGVAAALNGEVVPREEWFDRALVEGDSIEIVEAVQGG